MVKYMKSVKYFKLELQRVTVLKHKPLHIFLPHLLFKHQPLSLPQLFYSSFPNSFLFPSSSIQLMFKCLTLSFHTPPSPSSDPIPTAFHWNNLLPRHCPSSRGEERAQKFVLSFNPYTWQHRVTRLHEILPCLLMSKSPLMERFFS